MSSYLNSQMKGLDPSTAARLFSSQLIQEVARYGQSSLLSRILNELRASGLSSDAPVSELFDSALSYLSKKELRHEYIYKAAIANKILLGRHSLRTATMLTEFRVGSSRADALVLNGTSTIYEIKSERDNLKRLHSQLDSYRKAFASVNVICGLNHVSEIERTIPEDVGVLVLNDRQQITVHRKAVNDTSTIDPEILFDSLQISESKKVLEKLEIDYPKDTPNSMIYTILKNRFKEVDSKFLHQAALSVLKETRSQKKLERLINSLPKSLSSLLVSTPLRNRDHGRLIDALGTPINIAMEWEKR